MKKLLISVFCACVIIGAAIAVYRFGFRKSIPQGTQEEQVMAILQQNDCFVCHSQNPKLPFYAKFPLIGNMLNTHVTHATDFTDLEAKTADLENIDPVTLSMIDYSAMMDNMPIMEYRLVHWGTGFTSKEKSIIAQWVLSKRGSEEPVEVIPAEVALDQDKVELGYKMFMDKRISLDGTLNCASCHILEIGGADEPDERTSEGINGLHGGVNAPTVYNSSFNIRQFWNGRAADLREQAEGPATNPVEMGDQTWDQIVERLSKDRALVKEFETLYPGEGLTRMTVTGAIAEFEKSLITPDSRFDKYLKGDSEAITAEELAGYKAFKENACATCHTGVALGGKSFERMPIFGDYFLDRDSSIEYNADDDGLKGFTGEESDLHRFKVPTLRNIEHTAPYFHDGQYNTLEEAVSAMAKYELGRELSEKDVKSIVAFMRTLSGKNKYLECTK